MEGRSTIQEPHHEQLPRLSDAAKTNLNPYTKRVRTIFGATHGHEQPKPTTLCNIKCDCKCTM